MNHEEEIAGGGGKRVRRRDGWGKRPREEGRERKEDRGYTGGRERGKQKVK